jgi:transcriptional regulator with XRE-family HTH domain
VRQRVREVRDRRGYSARELGERVAALGIVSLDREVIANFENGRRRSVSVEELVALALALDVAPAFLVFGVDPDASLAMTPRGDAVEARTAWRWFGGTDFINALPDADQRRYFSEQPEGVWRNVVTQSTYDDLRDAGFTPAALRAFGERLDAIEQRLDDKEGTDEQ